MISTLVKHIMQSTAEVWTKGSTVSPFLIWLSDYWEESHFPSGQEQAFCFHNLFYGIWMWFPYCITPLINIPDISLLQSLVFPQVSGQGKTAYQALHNIVTSSILHTIHSFFCTLFISFSNMFRQKSSNNYIIMYFLSPSCSTTLNEQKVE